LKDLVLKKFGEAVWLDLLAKAGITQDFVENKNYDDQVIYTLLTVAAQVCFPPPGPNVSFSSVLPPYAAPISIIPNHGLLRVPVASQLGTCAWLSVHGDGGPSLLSSHCQSLL
jgi:hypothetical protein